MWAHFFLPWVLSGILATCVSLLRDGRPGHLVVIVGRHWPPPSDVGRPRDGPASTVMSVGLPRCAAPRTNP